MKCHASTGKNNLFCFVHPKHLMVFLCNKKISQYINEELDLNKQEKSSQKEVQLHEDLKKCRLKIKALLLSNT